MLINNLKVLHINSSYSSGGASRACVDIHNALVERNIDSRILVQSGNPDSPRIHSININLVEKIKTYFRIALDLLLIKIFSIEERGRFSIPLVGKDITKLKLFKEADIINLHWVNEGFFSLQTLKSIAASGKPVVWTLHDMWAFTGGCHYSLGCRKYETKCSVCPSLKFRGENDFSDKIFNDKLKLYNGFRISVVTCSQWLASVSGKSTFFKDKDITVIPNTLKTDIYKPLDKAAVLRKLNLDADNRYILFGTMTLNDERKGFDLFINCIKMLSDSFPGLKSNLKLLVAGSKKKMDGVDLPLETIFLGRLKSESEMADFYNAGSLFIAPSREDNLPNTVMESLSCGTPVIAFNIGGMPDMIDHKANGYLAEPFNVSDLMKGIMWVLDHPDPNGISKAARNKTVKLFNYSTVAESYSTLYHSVLK